MKRTFNSHLFLSFIFIFSLAFLALFSGGMVVYSADELCTGDFRTNLAAAQDCIAKAIAKGEALGYDISCKVEQLGLGGFTDPTSGKDYILNPVCTVNDSPGHGAYTLVGFSAMPKCTTEQLQRIQTSGSSDTFASEGCSNAIITGVNPGWDILKTELGYESAFYQCGGKTPYGSVVNGVSVYTCTDPNPPKIVPGGGPTINPVVTGGSGGTSGDRILGCASTSGVSTITGQSCSGTVYSLDKDNDGIPDEIDDEVDFIDNGVTARPRPGVAVYTPPSSTGDNTCSVVRSGIQKGVYRYTFSKNTNGTWNVSLNNKAYSVPSDKYYVPANYSILATSAAELNIRNQGRFNHLESLPGTATGNTEYSNLFGSFNNAYYDWDNMTKDVPACTGVAAPTTVSPLSISTQPVLVGIFPIASFPVEVVVIVEALNTRTGPYTTSPLASNRPLRKDSTFTATGWVTGESVSGINVWYVSTNGNYIWSGGTRKVAVSH